MMAIMITLCDRHANADPVVVVFVSGAVLDLRLSSTIHASLFCFVPESVQQNP
jgi:hypothetical protein